MKRQPETHEAGPGQDSFLDIVSNLVGILIILVMVIGVQAKYALLEHREAPENHKARQALASERLHTSRMALASLESDMEALVEKLERQAIELAYRQRERDHMLLAIESAKAKLASYRATRDRDEQVASDLSGEIARLEHALRDVARERAMVDKSVQTVHVLRHDPTPMAKTVFGKEVHFRLKDDHIVWVPLERLVEVFKEDARRQVWKLRDSPSLTDIVGPVGGFRLRYTIRKRRRMVASSQGPALAETVELEHFDLLPVREPLGEPVSEALAEGSQFLERIGQLVPRRTIVTIWVYPESFPAFRTIKEMLADRGFAVAGRPLPEDRLISGSPQGTRSAAQ